VRLGIDFGTTRTVVAAALDGRYPVASFRLEGGHRGWLRGMAAPTEDGWVFGEDAVRRLRAGAPGHRSLKRSLSALAPDAPMDGGGTALEVATGFLRHLHDALRNDSTLRVRPDEPLEAMFAVPAAASSRQRYLTLEAARRAGFEVLGLLNEPSAAAIEYAHRERRVLSKRSPKRYAVVYDLGGGTFDASAVSLEGRSFELLSHEGLLEAGGDDIDALILEAWEEATGDRVDGPARVQALELCRAAKESIHARSRRLLLDPDPDLPLAPVVLDLQAIYARCEPLLERTLRCLTEVFDALPSHIDQEDPRQLAALYLVGGTVAFPVVNRRLRQRYGRKVQLAPEPHAATAVGLAVAADPEAQVRVREVPTRYFGVWREARGGHDKVFDLILSKQSAPGEVIVERHYRPVHRVGHLRYLECTRLDDGGRPSGELAPYGELWFPYDPSLQQAEDLAPLAEERTDGLASENIVERYAYRKDGTIAVRIENLTRGYGREVRLGA
jgi:molecular chaperone DnaK (HSP70)